MSEFVELTNLINAQRVFERDRIGTDGTLEEYNTAEFMIVRGLIGESVELYDAMRAGTRLEQLGELADILIFTTGIMGLVGITSEELNEAVVAKMERNEVKYKPEYFEGRTVREGLAYSRQQWAKRHLEPGTQND